VISRLTGHFTSSPNGGSSAVPAATPSGEAPIQGYFSCCRSLRDTYVSGVWTLCQNDASKAFP